MGLDVPAGSPRYILLHKWLERAALDPPICILVFACEISSSQVTVELEDAERNEQTSIGPFLFSDGAAAPML